MKKLIALIIVIFCLFLIIGCDNNNSKKEAQNQNDHLFKTQTDALEKAKAVEDKIQQKFNRDKKELDKQSR